ncbi:MAG: peptidoglycan DD-metalloendopeptidase family protein [Gemmatimonadota bacterium]|jgi:murein DD-endopeptidase MepM/ murein hydrolase activator NlpD|nr:peptidoglycan DD-metalloendopeptidase family protein [Gemmatimonadota bacterium]MDP6802158.1 peptidoglycan DD-metalloendopeptidase family protein [Gemmatimonadota bacterium]
MTGRLGRTRAVVLLAAFALYVLVRLVGPCGESSGGVDSITAVIEAPEAQPAGEDLRRLSRKVGQGEPLDLVLRRLDVPGAWRMEAERLLGEEIDLRRILPGETVGVAWDTGGALREVSLVRDALTSVVVTFPDSGSASVAMRVREPEIRLRAVTGRVNGSLYESVIAAGGEADLVMRFADLLGWEVDFLTEPRSEDSFRMLVEERRLDGEFLGFGKIYALEYDGARASGRAVRYEDDEGKVDWYDDEGSTVRRAFLKSPLQYRRISSRFSARRRHPILKTVRPHWGVDYAAPRGTPVSALGEGVVTFAGRKGGYGNYVEIRHSSSYTTCYAHLWKFGKGIRRGVRVAQGQVIGLVGSTGLSTGPHLDFRVKRNGDFVDPLRLKSPPGRSVPGEERESFDRSREIAWHLADSLAVTGESMALLPGWSEDSGSGEKSRRPTLPGDDATR